MISTLDGAGKTAFVERLLRATDRCVQAARCRREPDLDEPRESSPAGHPELKRYLAAGADGATVYRFPESDPDAFFCSRFMESPSDVVLEVEGERPVGYVDLDVFVAPVPGPRKKLLRQVKRNLARERRATVARMRTLLKSRDGTAQLVNDLMVAPLALFAESRLVVINIRGDAERRRGEQVLEDVLRLRKDTQVFEDIFGWRGSRSPITAVVADLGNERDPGLKKAVRRALRAFAD